MTTIISIICIAYVLIWVFIVFEVRKAPILDDNGNFIFKNPKGKKATIIPIDSKLGKN